tara:strand:+ start:110 stop:526 length:417 start_codon:yes stop_codon:yes gene_type:complete
MTHPNRKRDELISAFVSANDAIGVVEQATGLPVEDRKELYTKYMNSLSQASIDLCAYLGFSVYDSTVCQYRVYDNRTSGYVANTPTLPRTAVRISPTSGEWTDGHVGKFIRTYFLYIHLGIEPKVRLSEANKSLFKKS